MSKADRGSERHLPPLRWCVFTVALLCSGLFGAAPAAAAAIEQVGTFAGSAAPVPDEEFAEEVQLGGVGGMAVNVNGSGGVKPGTVYAATQIGGGAWVAMFTPDPEGRPEFVEAWQVRSLGGPYEPCGPEGELPNGESVHPSCAPRVGGLPGKVDVEVHQATGNVYVYTGELGAGMKAVVIYTPDGGEEITRFGELAATGESVAESPEKIHNSFFGGGIAVNGSGRVYVFDETRNPIFYHRLMVFEPVTPGDFDDYAYAGEVASGPGGSHLPTAPVTDTAGNVYVGASTVSGEFVEVYEEETPAPYPAPVATAVCEFKFPKSGITAMTPDPVSGDVFFFSYKTPKRIHQLGPCDAGTGEFEQIPQTTVVAPERDDISALVFDPAQEFSAARQPGVLYGGAPSPVPSSGVGPGQPGQSSLGYIFAAPEESPPEIEAESVSKVTARSARLETVIDPRGFETDYAFQYLTEAEYLQAGENFAGATEVGDGTLKGTGPQSVALTLTGLAPDTEYRYRVVASSKCAPGEPGKVCEVTGAANAFRTYTLEVQGPPDGRAYELVSPAQKHGGQVFPADPRVDSCPEEESCKPGIFNQHFPMQSSPDGEAVVFQGSSFGSEEGAAIENEYLARRSALGWQSANLTPPLLQSSSGGGYKAFDTGLTEGVLEQPSPSLSPDALPEYDNLYTQPSHEPLTLGPLVVSEPPNRTAGQFTLNYAGASADLSRVFFAANDALTGESAFAPAAIAGGTAENNLYEWETHSGQLRLVNVAPGNASSEPGARFRTGSAHTISADGRRAFWTSKAGQLYVREDGEVTRAIPGGGEFLAAATDGSRVLLDNGEVYDLEANVSTDLTDGKGGFLGLVGQSDDLSRIYFVEGPAKGSADLVNDSTTLTDVKVTTGAYSVGQAIAGAGIPAGTTIVAVGAGTLELSAAANTTGDNVPLAAQALLAGEAENSEGDSPQVGGINLYAWREGSIAFVATLVAGDNSGGTSNLSHDWAPSPSNRTAQASPGGRFLTFLSQVPLTGYDNIGPCESDHAEGLVSAPCPEAFLYDSASGRLHCASCNPSGAAPLGWTVLRLITGPSYLSQPRYLTDTGRLYFDSRDSLSPFDTNGGVEDVYQWQPEGIGGCEREGGCVALVSAGREAWDSNFLAIDPSGKNVFFTSRDRLVSHDTDEQIDLYDAREAGGFPWEEELPKTSCQGETCQPPPPPLVEPPPSSSTITDPGNAKPTKPCKKGRVKKKGKCVSKHKGKAKHKKREGAK